MVLLLVSTGVVGVSNTAEESYPIIKSNNPPYVPSEPIPPDGAHDVPIILNLSWDGGDPDPDDMVTYEIYFGDEPNPPYIMLIGPYSANWTRLDYSLDLLECSKTYYWQIVACDNHGSSSDGPIWNFTTYDNNWPPSAPNIEGLQSVRPGTYEYKFMAVDPEWDNIYYEIYWGDNHHEDWFGPYESGEEIARNHTYSDVDTVLIKVRCKDIHGAIGGWGTFEVEISKNRQIFNLPFLQFLMNMLQFPFLHRLLGWLIL